MSMLISKIGTLIQIRIRVGNITSLLWGPMRGQYVFLMTKSIFVCVCVCVFFFVFFFFVFFFFLFFFF